MIRVLRALDCIVRVWRRKLTAEMTKLPESGHKGQYAVSLSLSDLAKACHLRVDDTAFTLSELGFLRYRRSSEGNPSKREEDDYDGGSEDDEADTDGKGDQ